MRIRTSLIAALIFANLVFNVMAGAKTKKRSSAIMHEESTTPFFNETTDLAGLGNNTSPGGQGMRTERLDPAKEENNTGTTQPESEEPRFPGKKAPNRMYLIFLHTNDEGRTPLSPKFCSFYEKLKNATNAFLSRAPSTQSDDQPILLKNALRQEGKRRTKELGKILLTFLTAPTAQQFPSFWSALNDLDLEPPAESAKRQNLTTVSNGTEANTTAVNETEANTIAFKLRNALTKLCKANSSDVAKKTWQKDAAFWKNVSVADHLLGVLRDNTSRAQSYPEKHVIRELAKIPRSQKNDWQKMIKQPFFHTPPGNVNTYEDRDQLKLELYYTCLWVMRVERQDRMVRKLIGYLSHDWRKVNPLFPTDVKLSFILDSYCMTISKMYATLDPGYYYPWALLSDTSNVVLSKEEYDFYLDFIGQKFYSSMYRETARTLLAIHEDTPYLRL